MSETTTELKDKIAEYEEQLATVAAALKEEPKDETLLTLQKEIKDVLQLTKDLLKQKEKPRSSSSSSRSSSSSSRSSSSSSSSSSRSSRSRRGFSDSPTTQKTAATISLFAIGETIEAKFSGDGKWYEAKIDFFNTERNSYTVTFTGYGNTEEVNAACIRKPVLHSTSDIGQKRKRETEDTELIEIPDSLKILPTDSEEIIARKKRKRHVIKSTNRINKLNQETNNKQATWKSFLTKKSKTRKTGFYTKLNKQSIFASPDGVTGKVGVTGSGKGVTSNPDRKVQHQKKAKLTLPPADINE